ncbi:MAG: mandelate racemase/muconate lactonizing enzyme family protein [Acidobacteriota bacterium]
MKLTRVSSFLLSYPLPEPVVLPEEVISKRDAMLIRVEADNGLVGYAPGEPTERAALAVEETVAPFLEGRILADPDALRVLFLHGPGSDSYLARVYSMVEIGLLDVIGKALDVPVSELLGGRVRERVRLYGSSAASGAPERAAEEAAALADMGFTAYRMRLGRGPANDARDFEFIRRTAAADFDLMADARAWQSSDAVAEAARALAEQRALWVEEPLASGDPEACSRLKRETGVSLAAGAHEASDDALVALLQSRAVDYVQMDIARQGGYPAARLVLTETAREGLRFAFRTGGTALDLVAAAHVAVCWPEMVAEWLEFPCYSGIARPGMYPFPLFEDILAEPLEIEAGDLAVPRKPGLGVEVNEAVIERYGWIPHASPCG